MLKQLTYFLLLVFVTGILTTCKKYPEGPCISFRSKLSRLKGWWEPILFTANGIDSLKELKVDSCYGPYIIYGEDRGGYNMDITNNVNCEKFGYCHFRNQYKNLEIEFSTSPKKTIIGPYAVDNEKINWTILRLTKKEMWLKVDYLGVNYECHFNKIKEI